MLILIIIHLSFLNIKKIDLRTITNEFEGAERNFLD